MWLLRQRKFTKLCGVVVQRHSFYFVIFVLSGDVELYIPERCAAPLFASLYCVLRSWFPFFVVCLEINDLLADCSFVMCYVQVHLQTFDSYLVVTCLLNMWLNTALIIFNWYSLRHPEPIKGIFNATVLLYLVYYCHFSAKYNINLLICCSASTNLFCFVSLRETINIISPSDKIIWFIFNIFCPPSVFFLLSSSLLGDFHSCHQFKVFLISCSSPWLIWNGGPFLFFCV